MWAEIGAVSLNTTYGVQFLAPGTADEWGSNFDTYFSNITSSGPAIHCLVSLSLAQAMVKGLKYVPFLDWSGEDRIHVSVTHTHTHTHTKTQTHKHTHTRTHTTKGE